MRITILGFPNLYIGIDKVNAIWGILLFFTGEKQMTYEKVDMRVLARAGARVLTQDEIAKVTGAGNLPTSHLSRDASGRPADITQD